MTRLKDGSQLIADFPNSQCYVQKATNINIFKEWRHSIYGWMGGNVHYTTVPEWRYENPSDRCWSAQGAVSGSVWSCPERSRTYTCDTNWLKLDNSTCEYRENF